MTGATLVISSLIGCHATSTSSPVLQKAGIDFTAVDDPNANHLTVHILIAVAQHEREVISERTKVALAAARARGTVLGGYKNGPAPDAALSVKARVAVADAFAAMVGPMIQERRLAGATLREIANRLTVDGIETVPWGPMDANCRSECAGASSRKKIGLIPATLLDDRSRPKGDVRTGIILHYPLWTGTVCRGKPPVDMRPMIDQQSLLPGLDTGMGGWNGTTARRRRRAR